MDNKCRECGSETNSGTKFCSSSCYQISCIKYKNKVKEVLHKVYKDFFD